MKPIFAIVLGTGLLGTLAGAACAGITPYTDQTKFINALNPGYYQEDFNALSTGVIPAGTAFPLSGTSSYTYSAKAVTLTTHTDDSFYNWSHAPGGPGKLVPLNTSDSITITFTSGNVYAVGGNFYLMDYAWNTASGSIKISVNGGAPTTYSVTSANDFFGFTSDTPITSLIIAQPTSTTGYPQVLAVDNLIVGSAAPVPEPASLVLAMLPVVSLATLRRRGGTASR